MISSIIVSTAGFILYGINISTDSINVIDCFADIKNKDGLYVGFIREKCINVEKFDYFYDERKNLVYKRYKKPKESLR